MRILLTGARGMLAADVKRTKPAGVDLVETDVGELDITKGDAVEEFCRACEPDLILNCAAYTAVDRAEQEPDAAFAVNETGPANLALACVHREIPFVHISTDYVFFGDGGSPLREDDPCRPQGVYARSKRAGELSVERAGGRWLTVRTSWLYGLGGPNFPDTILRLAREKERLTVVDDQRGSPTLSNDLAEAIWKLIEKQAAGYEHFCNSGVCTWNEFAREIIGRAQALGLLPSDRRVEVAPISSRDLGRAAPRPAYSVLSTERYSAVTGLTPPPWQQALERYLRSRVDRC